MKRFLILAVLLTILIVPLAAQTIAQEEVTISIIAGEWWFNPENVGLPNESQGYTLMQEYMEMHPEITFDFRGVPFPELDNTQFAAMEANQGPDIMIINSVTIGAFIDRGYVMPMDEFIEASDLDTSVFYESLFAAGRFQDFIVALPLDTGTRLLFWNRSLFEEAGLEPPTRWDELIDVAVEMTDEDAGVRGYVAASGERWLWLYEHAGMYSTANGLQFVNDEATECVLDQGDNPQIIQFWMDMYDTGILSDDDLFVGLGGVRELAFGNNLAAMYLGGHWSAGTLENEYDMVYPDDYGITILEGDAGIGSTTGGWLISLSRDAEHPQEAIDFIAWLIGTPENLVQLTNIMPSTEAASEITLLEEFYDPFKELLASENTQHPIPLNPGLPEQAEDLRNVTQSALQGDMTAQEAAEAFCEQIEGTLFPME